MKRLEKCSRCNEALVLGPFNHTQDSGIWIDHGGRFSTRKALISAYICISCGYIENYITKNDLIKLKEYLRLTGVIK